MRDLLPHYERELSFLATHTQEFAERYPRIAGRLSTSGNLLEDPHVERLVQSFALLSARIHKRLDDDFPKVTEALLEVLYPHYLRPFPACSIASFVPRDTEVQLTSSIKIDRGLEIQTRPVRGVPCRFVTAFDVHVMPVAVLGARWVAAALAPDGTHLPKGTTSVLSIDLELTSPQARWDSLGVTALRFFLDGDTSLVTALRETLCGYALGALFQQQGRGGPWQHIPQGKPRPVGFAADEALLPFDERSAQAYRLLTEYFAFAEKFNFVDLPLPATPLNASKLTLHYPMSGLRADDDAARLLESIGPKNFRLSCTPVVNRFRQQADPILITHTSAQYPVLPDPRRAYAFEVYSIDRVYRVQQSQEGESVDLFQPFYSLHHEELLAEGPQGGRYWYASRDSVTADRAPGFETEICVVDTNFDPSEANTDTLSVEITATNRDMPSQISIGQLDGDLLGMSGTLPEVITLLRKPTRSERFERGNGALWRLVSHLSLNHLSLSGAGIEGLKELLRLYDLPRSSVNKRLLDGLISVEHKAAVAWLPGEPFATFVRGVEVNLTVDRDAFVGSGLHLFAQLLEHFLALYVQINSFVQLKLICQRSGEVLVQGQRRTGEGALL
jgi:type VI secretion system protein ImpG